MRFGGNVLTNRSRVTWIFSPISMAEPPLTRPPATRGNWAR